MAKYIDKAAVVAEIKRRLKGLDDCHADRIAGYAGEISGLKRLLSFIDALEVKEVDLEKEINTWFDYGFPNDDELLDYIKETAKHFFELGLKAKGE